MNISIISPGKFKKKPPLEELFNYYKKRINLKIDLKEIKTFNFEIVALVYDGIPENMNNGSMWIGPEVELGGFSFRPTLFLNFFGLGLFILFYSNFVHT